MSSRYMHRAGPISAAIEPTGLGLTACGRLLSWNGAKTTAPPCPKCEDVARRKGWAPYGKNR